jgi:hypothetical protein
LHLPNTKKNSKLTYPRIPTVYAANDNDNKKQNDDLLFANLYKNLNPPQRLVNQYNLNEQTKLKLYTSTNSRKNSLLHFETNSNYAINDDDEQKELNKK